MAVVDVSATARRTLKRKLQLKTPIKRHHCSVMTSLLEITLLSELAISTSDAPVSWWVNSSSTVRVSSPFPNQLRIKSMGPSCDFERHGAKWKGSGVIPSFKLDVVGYYASGWAKRWTQKTIGSNSNIQRALTKSCKHLWRKMLHMIWLMAPRIWVLTPLKERARACAYLLLGGNARVGICCEVANVAI